MEITNSSRIPPKRNIPNVLDLSRPPQLTSPQPKPQNPPKPPQRHRPRPKLTKSWLVLCIVVGLVVGLVVLDSRYRAAQRDIKRLSSSQKVSEQQTQQVQDKIGKLVELPSKETPTIATVTDITKLKDQPFFANAKNDDQILIYTQAKRAIIYRPSTNKIVEVGPVNIGSDAGTSTTTPKSK